MDVGTFGPVHISWANGLIRIGAALLFSFALGIERFIRKKPVDFRPFVIIALASCTLSLGITEFAYRTDDEQLSIDPAKVVSGILTGIGFIGAGAVFREKNTVHGAGSAASIWASGAVGITCGLGMIWLAGLLALGVVLVLVLSKPFTEDYTATIDEPDPRTAD